MRPSADAAERKGHHDRMRQGDAGGHFILAADVVPLEAEAVVDAGVDALQGGALGAGPPPGRGAAERRREDERVHLLERDAQGPPEAFRRHARPLTAQRTSSALQAVGRRRTPVLQASRSASRP